MKKPYTQIIFEECKSGQWVCNRWFHKNAGWNSWTRRKELVKKLNREDPKYHWYWDTPKQCDCRNAKRGVVHHRLRKSKI